MRTRTRRLIAATALALSALGIAGGSAAAVTGATAAVHPYVYMRA
jgi:hypothetical protein